MTLFRMPAFLKQMRIANQRHQFCNNSATPLVIMVEMIPSRYVLSPGDELEMTVNGRPSDVGLSVIFHRDCVQIYAAWDVDPKVTINGQPAVSDWDTPGPDLRP
ncbi:hypothetical protein SAMN06295912_13419 [Sphingomonas laterariae]|uniref:Uncharacterized protein n=1 Tax=Edaphosphingomonas laterariae TaxID=861865 RepID=A0A239JFX9_9SPHN|nr:hypothetical protein [Sphingomonas laterariae]SNT04727.1 hypothetical protein SAMN06295912_13419 [Sphingomonas laterariae]